MTRLSLQTRILLYTVVLVTVTSVLFAYGALTLKNRLEEATFGRMVREQMQFFLQENNEAVISEAESLAGWRLRSDITDSNLPPELAELPAGSHHSIRIDDEYFQVEIASRANETLYLTYEITAWEEQEHEVLQLLFVGAIAILIIAILAARATAKASLKPLSQFTSRLADIQPDQRDVHIAADFGTPEVHQIAREFDRYLKRLDDFVEREKFVSAAASHELRTPLSIIIGAIDVIDANSTDQRNDKALNRMRRACDEMLAFIEATLFLSREDSKPEAEAGTTNLHDLLNELIEDFAPSIQRKHITINNHLEPQQSASQRHSILKIVVGNILRNAVEHTVNGTIDVSMQDQALRIVDTGEGIAADKLEQIFDRSYTTKTTGFGMGLTLVKKLCDLLDWTLTLESMRGQGTVVTVNLEPGM